MPTQNTQNTSETYRTKISESIDILRNWYQIMSLTGVAQESLNPEGGQSEFLNKLYDLILGNTINCFSTNDIIEKINNLSAGSTNFSILSTIKKYVAKPSAGNFEYIVGYQANDENSSLYKEIVGENYYNFAIKNYPGTVNTITGNNEKLPSIENPTFSIFECNIPRINPTMRYSEILSVFMNAIPTHEIAKCVPYLDVSLITRRTPLEHNTGDDNRYQGPTIYKFLEGSSVVKEGTVAYRLVSSLEASYKIAQGEEVKSTMSGMELFTSPQTMVNPSLDAPFLDVFRPFGTITSFDVDVAGLAGLMSYKTAKLAFILHDRARMSEIIDFLRPNQYMTTEFMIEYGWSHPEGYVQDINKNPYASFINNLRVREKYGISNYTYDIDEVGQVNINLSLYLRGQTEILDQRLLGYQQVVFNALFSIFAAIKELRSNIDGNLREQLTEYRSLDIFTDPNRALAAIFGNVEATGELNKLLQTLNSTQNRSGPLAEIFEKLKEIYEISDESNTPVLQNRWQNAIVTETNLIKRLCSVIADAESESGKDPFIIETQQNTGLNLNHTHISLGKLFTIFVETAIIRSGEFEDVQFVFYDLNNNCIPANHPNISQSGNANENAKNYNISRFLIPRAELSKLIEKIVKLRGLANMTIGEFMRIIVNNFVSNLGSFNYRLGVTEPNAPFNDNIRIVEDGESLQSVISSLGDNDDLKSTVNKAKDKALLERVQRDMTSRKFQKPELSFYIDCMPMAPVDNGESQIGNSIRSVLRVHVFDKTANAYESEYDLLNIYRDMPPINQQSPTVEAEAENSPILIAQSRKLVDVDAETGTIIPVASLKKMQDFIMERVPTLVVGSQTSGVRKVSIKSMNDQRLATVNMIRQDEGQSELTPQGITSVGLPVFVYPASISLELFGCPFVQFAQSFYLNANTNTTIDNVYAITKITHSIKPGSFESRVEAVPLDAYGRYTAPLQMINQFKLLREASQTSTPPVTE